jgi:hypothetical protein
VHTVSFMINHSCIADNSKSFTSQEFGYCLAMRPRLVRSSCQQWPSPIPQCQFPCRLLVQQAAPPRELSLSWVAWLLTPIGAVRAGGVDLRFCKLIRKSVEWTLWTGGANPGIESPIISPPILAQFKVARPLHFNTYFLPCYFHLNVHWDRPDNITSTFA